MLAIEVDNVTRTFRVAHKQPGLAGSLRALFRPHATDRVAVDHISFSVEPGEIVGYIGVNGAGKSTTIKLLTGILVPTSGRVRVLGRDPVKQRVANARDIGVVFGQRSQLWWDLPLSDSLQLLGKIYEVEPSRYRRLMAEFVEILDLDEILHAPIRTMSLGQKMRAELAATFIHEPEVVYLDEPTIGLDLVVKERIREVIREQNRAHGTTVILTTHDLGDIEELCPRVMIIDHGRLIYDGPLQTIRDRFGTHRILTLETSVPLDVVPLPPGSEIVERDDRTLVVRFDRTVTTASKVTAAVMQSGEVVDFTLKEPDLTSIVREIYGGALANEAAL